MSTYEEPTGDGLAIATALNNLAGPMYGQRDLVAKMHAETIAKGLESYACDRRYPPAHVFTGTVAQPAAIRGTFDPGRMNFFCASCRSFVQSPPGATAMRECPTPGCTRLTGFGVHAKTPRPRIVARIPAS